MPNVLGNYNETFFAQEALIQLEKVLGMAGRVHRGYGPDPQVKGDTIQIRKPSTFTAQDAPSTKQDVDTKSTSIVLSEWKEVKFALTDKDLALTSDRIISDHIRPAAYALADQIDTTLAGLYVDVPWYNVWTATPALEDLNASRRVLFDNEVPMNDGLLHCQLDGAAEEAFLNAMAASGQQSGTQDPALRNASIGRLFGIEVFANQNAPIHTSSTAADAVGAVNNAGGYAAGVSTIAIDGVSASETFLEGDTFVFAGHTQRYSLTADATSDGTGAIASMSFTPALAEAVADDEVVTFFLGGASKAQRLVFHRNAFALATAPLSEMGNELGARIASVADPKTGLALRSRLYYMPDLSEVHVALDILYGVKTLDGNLAVRGFEP